VNKHSADYQEFSWKYINQIIDALAEMTKVIVFGKEGWFALNDMANQSFLHFMRRLDLFA
jgi:uroporphyrinogen-III decarboxylase